MNALKTTLLLGTLTALLVAMGELLGGDQGALIAFGFALAMNFVSYWWSDRIVLALHRAREVTPEEEPRLHAIVDRLCARARLPKPRVYILDDPSPNAFATGRNPHHAAICATSGILSILDNRELEGVLGHELGHVENRDILISTIAASLAGAISMLASWMRWGMMWGGYSRRDDRRGSNPVALIGTLLAIVLAPLVAMLVQLAVSRSREYGADQEGARLCGDPEALASALAKIARGTQEIPLATATAGTAPLFIESPFGPIRTLLSTHPPIEERIRRLEAMAHHPIGR
jgi:heat shock protein HtpX